MIHYLELGMELKIEGETFRCVEGGERFGCSGCHFQSSTYDCALPDKLQLSFPCKPGNTILIKTETRGVEKVIHPKHYGGDTTYEAIKVIEAWQLGFCLGNAVKYISRAGKKSKETEIEDLEKAAFYINREIKKLKEAK